MSWKIRPPWSVLGPSEGNVRNSRDSGNSAKKFAHLVVETARKRREMATFGELSVVSGRWSVKANAN
jgi:hypothetical protein